MTDPRALVDQLVAIRHTHNLSQATIARRMDQADVSAVSGWSSVTRTM